MSKKKYYIASVSWGKDSVAMLLLLIALKRQVDLVLFVSTGKEFKAVYAVRDKVLELLKIKNIPYVEIDVSEEFEYLMFTHKINTRDGSEKIGYGWCGGACRWGTCLKLSTIARYIRNNLSEYEVYEYVGIAADEPERISSYPNKIYPLYELGVTEMQALDLCYMNGLLYEEDGTFLYEALSRLSCWCCRNSNLKELKAMYYLLPGYFNGLKQLQLQFPHMPMKGEGASVFDLEKRFKKEGRMRSLYEIFPYPLQKEKEGQLLRVKEHDVVVGRQIS